MNTKLISLDNNIELSNSIFMKELQNCPSVIKIITGFPELIYNNISFKTDVIAFTKKGLAVFIDKRNQKLSLDNVYFKYQSILLKREELRNKRDLSIFFDVYELKLDSNTISFEDENFLDLKDNVIRLIENVITSSLKIRTDTSINLFSDIDMHISNFDSSQLRAISHNQSKIQVITGLAGSGKTIILARKIAHEYTSNPVNKILVTYYTRSLKYQFKQHIDSFLSMHDIPASEIDNIDMLVAWGNDSGDGVYSSICNKLNITPVPYYAVSELQHPFRYVCSKLLKHIEQNTINIQKYDYIFIDEAQDLGDIFLNLCLKLLNPGGKLVYAYDVFQDLNETNLPLPSVIFPDIDQNEINETPLEVCYRTPKKNLILAHSFGMGINTHKLSMFVENPSQWKLMGYKILEGGSSGTKTTIDRDQPSYFNSIKEETVSLSMHATLLDMLKNANSLVVKYLKIGLDFSDIMLIDLDASSADKDYRMLCKIGDESTEKIEYHYAFSNFNEKNRITFTNVFRAKGNEAKVVIIINSDRFETSTFRSSWRNKIFTAITRSKMFVYLLSSNPIRSELLNNEYLTVKNNGFKLVFDYPTDDQINTTRRIAAKESKHEKSIDIVTKEIKKLPKDLQQQLIEEIKNQLEEK